MNKNIPSKTIRIKAETLLRLYRAKGLVGMDERNNMPTLDRVIEVALDAYEEKQKNGAAIEETGEVVISTNTARQDHMDTLSLGAKLADARKRKGLTQQELSFQLGLRQSMVSMIEMDKTTPSLPVFVRLLQILDISPAEALQ